jgi:hypothetical protein
MSATKTYPAEGGFLVAGRLAATFVAGFIGIAVFHQGSSWLLYKLGIYPVAQYKMQPLPPFGVPRRNVSGAACGRSSSRGRWRTGAL